MDTRPARPASTDETRRLAIPSKILDGRVIAIGRGLPPDRLVPIAQGLAAGGVRAFEITLDSPDALAAIERLTAHFDPDTLLIGAGTVMSVDAARAAIDVGARFIVMPHTDVTLIETALDLGVPAFPGAFTPTEVLRAWRAGATAVKLFPASAVGPSFVRELRGPLPEVPLIPTGGVTVETAPAFIAAGAVAIGIGSWLTGGGDPTAIGERGRQLIEALRTARA